MENSVVIVGSGIMGIDISAIFCRAGWNVQIIEPVESGWAERLRRITMSTEQIGGSVRPELVRFSPNVASTDFHDARLVIETVTERLDVKREVFLELDKYVPSNVPIGSNSSSLPISDISRGCGTANRMANTHFFLPAHIVPLVEIAKGKETDDKTCQSLREIFLEVGRIPVVIQQDIPGFLANRIQHALMREVFSLIDKKLATVEDVNAAVQYGFGFRYVAAGPILQKEFAGFETQLSAASTIYPSLCNDEIPAAVLRQLVSDGKYGVKTGEGFRRWTPEEALATKVRYERVLLKAAALLTESEVLQ